MRPRLELNPVSHNEAKLYLIPSKFTSNIFTALFKLVNAEVAFEFPLATVCIIFKALVVVLALNLVASSDALFTTFEMELVELMMDVMSTSRATSAQKLAPTRVRQKSMNTACNTAHAHLEAFDFPLSTPQQQQQQTRMK